MDIVDKVAAHSAEPDTWTVCFECDSCGVETEAARNEAGWRVLGETGWSGDPDIHVFCPKCTKDGWRTAELGKDDEPVPEKSPAARFGKLLGVECYRCARAAGFQTQDDILAPLALVQTGWQLIVFANAVGFICPNCMERDS